MTRRLQISVLVLAVLSTGAQAQQAEPDTAAVWKPKLDDPDLTISLWPPKLSAYGLVWLPNVTVADRTGLGLGLDTVVPYNLRDDRESLTSELAASFTGTTEGQWRFNLGTDLFWNANHNYASTRVAYDNLAREFFGIGPASEEADVEIYRPNEIRFHVETTWRIGDLTLAVGPRFEYEHHAADHLTEGGQLDSGEIPGTAGGGIFSLGLVMNWDYRDDRYQPSEGWYIQSRFMRFHGATSEEYRFWWFSLDWRSYRRITHNQVFAGQFFMESVSDTAPFWRLPSLGGRANTRAYSRDRWLDEVLLSGQAEWRWQALERWGFVGFAGAAVVARSLEEVESRYLRPTFGIGVRYVTESGGEAVPLRLDFAVGHQNWRVTLGIAEAF